MTVLAEPFDCGIPGVVLEPGDHVCAMYYGPAERDDVLLPFLRAGLREGNKCLCLIDRVEPSELLTRVMDGADAAPYVTSKQLEIDRATSACLSSGAFSTEHMMAYLEQTIGSATARGAYPVARAASEMSWVLPRPHDSRAVVEYESELNRFAPRLPQVLMCLYDLELFGGGMVLDLLKTHPTVLVRATFMDNPHYLTPQEFAAGRS